MSKKFLIEDKKPVHVIKAHHVPAFGPNKVSFIFCPVCGEVEEIDHNRMYSLLVEYHRRKNTKCPPPSVALHFKFYFVYYSSCCQRGDGKELDACSIPHDWTQLK